MASASDATPRRHPAEAERRDFSALATTRPCAGRANRAGPARAGAAPRMRACSPATPSSCCTRRVCSASTSPRRSAAWSSTSWRWWTSPPRSPAAALHGVERRQPRLPPLDPRLLRSETQREVWDANPDALIASSIALAAGRGRKTDGGFVVSGRWPFSSGVDNSDWNMLAVTVYGDDGKTRRLAAVPGAQVRLRDHRHLVRHGHGRHRQQGHQGHRAVRAGAPRLALQRCRGGASIPAPRSMRVRSFASRSWRLQPSAGAGGAGRGRGCLRDVLASMAKRMGTYTGAKVADFQAVQIKVARARCLIDSARALLRQSAIAFQDGAERDEIPDLATKLRYRARTALPSTRRARRSRRCGRATARKDSTRAIRCSGTCATSWP